MWDPNRKKLGDMLVELGAVTKEQLNSELIKQKATNKRIGTLLIEDGIISEDDIIGMLEVQLGVPRKYLDMEVIDEKAVRAIPEGLARKYILIPMSFSEGKINVIMNDPLDIVALDDVKLACGWDVEPFIASKKEIIKAIDKYYSNQQVEKVADELYKEKQTLKSDKNVEREDNVDEIKNAPAVRLVDFIISNSIKARASDIHIEPFSNYVKIRYRVDGKLKEILKLGIETLPSLVTRIKILSNIDIVEKRMPQEGRTMFAIDGKEIDLRISIVPTIYGEKIVIRILNKDSLLINKNTIGFHKDEIRKIDNIIKSPYGIILVTGPTGSGKSTTLYSLLNDINDDEKNIVTIEDPVEFMVEGINQINVNTKVGLTFASGLKSILRQDPDIIMIGEIRDHETAEIAIKAAITGHLVLSTLHTNDAPSSIIRLIDMGIEPYLVATSISGVVAQRLIRKICPRCKLEYKANEYEKRILGLHEEDEVTLYKGEGCAHCSHTGYEGRTAVYEIMEIGRKHKEYIMANRSSDDIRDLSVENGMNTLKMACTRLVLEGITTIDELAKIAFIRV